MLVSIFKFFCFNCKGNNPNVEVRCIGSMAIVTQSCKYCKKEFKWKSQPLLYGNIPAGNLMTSYSILASGVNISQTFLMFRHLGLSTIALRTFFHHQRKFLFPSILLYWEKQRSMLIEKLKCVKDVQWSGDGRFNSMGHNAKYGVYTMYCNTISKLVHFELVQVSMNFDSNFIKDSV